MLLQSVVPKPVMIPFTLSFCSDRPSRLWLLEEDGRFALILDFPERLIYLGKCWGKLCRIPEPILGESVELPSFDWAFDPDDFAVNSYEAYLYKNEYCLSELDLLHVECWSAIILERETIFFDPRFRASFRLCLKNSSYY
jgi:hypothetical protein